MHVCAYYIHIILTLKWYVNLQVLETCVKNCGRRFHLLISQKDFILDLVKLIGPKNDPPTAVQEKVLSLIQVYVYFVHVISINFFKYYISNQDTHQSVHSFYTISAKFWACLVSSV